MSGGDNFDLCPGCDTVKPLAVACCAHCGARSKRCVGCRGTYVTCSDRCRVEWRKTAATAFVKPEPLRGGGRAGA